MSDFKNFKHFETTHTLFNKKCLCGKDFRRVSLTESSRDVLTVRCEDKHCPGFSLARRKGTK